MVCACYSPYRLTMTTGAAGPFRFRPTGNRAGDPYQSRAGRVRMGAGTGPNWGRFGGSSNPFGAVTTASPSGYTTHPRVSKAWSPPAAAILPFAPRLSLPRNSVGHIAPGLRQWCATFAVLNGAESVDIYCLLVPGINIRIPLINRFTVNRYIFITRIVLHGAYAGCCTVHPLPLHWHINTIADCTLAALACSLD